jgi:catechol 2,3-dioxygenase-like lactoylglutathione lyase family enzyme
MMLHHVSVGVRDVAKSATFYDKVLKALGYKRVMEVLPYGIGYGDKHPEFWVQLPADQKTASVGNGVHISFAARNKAAVNAFHAAAMANGGKNEGAPGSRPDYGPDYYGAFCRDVDGNKIEAVVVKTPAQAKAAKPAVRKTAKSAKKTKRR